MSQVHHIHRQQLLLEATAMLPSEASQWHQRLERLQQRSLLPALRQQLDALAPDGEIVELERVEVSLSLADIEDIDEDLAQPFRRALTEALERARKKSQPPPTVLNSLLHFLLTGNFPVSNPPLSVVRKQLDAQTKHWSIGEWRQLAEVISTQPGIRLGRLAQVQGKLQEQCFTQLLAATPASQRSALRHQLKSSTGSESAWQEVLNTTDGGVVRDSKLTARPSGETRKKPARDQGISPQTTFFVPNAGLIILHPYLKYLASQQSAFDEAGNLLPEKLAALLQYAVARNEEFREWEHPLTKILLGLPPNAPLQAATLTDDDKTAVDDLLQGIIKHWRVLKRTSPDGLRQGFLRRPGKLVRQSRGWQLTIEQHAQDLLLAHLPWSIGMIKTPWMKEMLQVNWP